MGEWGEWAGNRAPSLSLAIEDFTNLMERFPVQLNVSGVVRSRNPAGT